jgi:hypothetical protein
MNLNGTLVNNVWMETAKTRLAELGRGLCEGVRTADTRVSGLLTS